MNGWLTIVTALFEAGLIPFFVRAAKSSGWLPQHQTPTFLPCHLRDRVDPGVLPGQLGHPGAREDLRDRDDLAALLPRREQVRQPVEAELGPSARDDNLRGDVRAADLERDVEPGLLVVALLDGRVVAGELRLRHPLQLQRDVGELGCCLRPTHPERRGDRGDGDGCERECEQRLSLHAVPLS